MRPLDTPSDNLAQAPLASAARGLGYRYGVMFSTEMGLPVYRRIGFRACGIGIRRFLWRAHRRPGP